MRGTGYIGLGDGPGRQLRLSLPHPCGWLVLNTTNREIWARHRFPKQPSCRRVRCLDLRVRTCLQNLLEERKREGKAR
jgi:hypothetical protein